MKISLNTVVVLAAILLICGSAFAQAETNDKSTINGFDITTIIVFLSSILAIALGVLSFIGYRRDGRIKILFVTFAFFIFAIKGILIIGSDLLSLQQPSLDIIANLLDFAILICFFVGMVLK